MRGGGGEVPTFGCALRGPGWALLVILQVPDGALCSGAETNAQGRATHLPVCDFVPAHERTAFWDPYPS